MTRRLLFAVAGVAGVILAGPVLADHEKETPGVERGGNGRMQERMAKKLELTADQQAKLKQLNEAHGPSMHAKHEAQGVLLKDLRELVKSKAADGVITAKLDALKKGRRDIEGARQAHEDAVAAVLTPTQKAKFVLWMTHKMDKGKHWQEGKDGKAGMDHQKGHHEKDGKDDDND